MPFTELFDNQVTRTDVVTTFLAILEMTKLGLSKIHQAGPNTEIHISASATQAEAENVLRENKLEE
jgi:segregation and condensation protein A